MTIEISKRKEPGLDGGFYFVAILRIGGAGVILRDSDLDNLEKRFRLAARHEGVRLPAFH